jgi:ABC-type phosphate/phosphonate transport system substrate-binding protein
MIATLPMYNWPEVRASTVRLWERIRDRLRASGIPAPDGLSPHHDFPATWLRPDLVLSQTCGFPYRTMLHGKVRLVGTPDFGVEGSAPGYYHSVMITRADRPGDFADFLGTTLAINGTDSQSGWAAPQNEATAHGRPFDRLVVTGAHLESARAVAAGRADIAGIDAVTWRFLGRFRPEVAAGLRVVARTEDTPGLPLITALAYDAGAVASAVAEAIAALAPDDRAALGLRGLATIPAGAYLEVPVPPVPRQIA